MTQPIKIITTLLLVLACAVGSAEKFYIIKGQVFDAQDKLTLPQAHILVDGGKGAGTVADIDGNYQVAVTQKEVILIFRYIGYEEQRIKVTFPTADPIVLNVAMKVESTTLQAVEVVGSRFGADHKKSIQTLEIVGVKQIDRANATTLDRALDNVAGLTIVDNEPQMRGGSGFSSGMGSRVMILLDEMPILRADAGRPAWNLIPMEDVSQIEIIKGAASVMFGSAAINGAINVRTAFAKSDPETKAKLYAGFYSKPQNKDLAQWDKDYPLLFGASLAHARKWKKFDFTFAAEYAGDDGFRGNDQLRNKTLPEYGITKEVIPAERRVRASIGTQYRPNSRWQIGLNANFLYSNNYQHHFWYNATESLYRAYPGTLSHFNDIMFFIDPTVKYISPEGGIHSIKNRVLLSDNQVLNLNNQNAASTTVYNEYQYKKSFKKAGDLELLTGTSNQYARSFGTVFAGNDQTIGTARSHFANNFAIYAKLEKSFFDKTLSLTLGGRMEVATIDTFTEVAPVFQFGINYFLKPSHTYFRASIGQGYRAATIGERYITTTVGNYGFFANPTLASEHSVNSEIAIKQLFRIGKKGFFEGFVDVAGFYQTYANYIEFCMGPWRNTTNAREKFGFKFFNTGPAKIKGIEATIAAQGKISDIFEYQFQVAYTYSLPQSTDPNYVYVSTLNVDYTYKNSAFNSKNNILKYRIQHVGKVDVNLKFINRITLGFSAQYFSQMANVDRIFMDMDRQSPYGRDWLNYMGDLPFEGMYNFMEKHKGGAWVLGLRVGWEAERFGVQVILNNFLNREYALRPLCIEAPRNVTIQLSYRFVDSNPPKLFQRRSKATESES